MKKIKRIMCILLSLTMVFNVFTTLPATADADVEEGALVSYVDRQWNDSTRKVESSTKYVNGDTVTEFTSNLVNLDTWYLVKGSVNVTHRLYVRGSATLILADGARLYCKDGINVSKGNTLNIYCQTQETGEFPCRQVRRHYH